MTPPLIASKLIKRFGTKEILHGVSFTVEPGKITGLFGPNGVGKTTVFKIILGLVQPDSGTVRFDRALDRLPFYKRARLGIGYLPQRPSVFAGLTVRENLLAVLQTVNPRRPNTLADQLLNRFELEPLADQKAGTLSGGEQRKLELARTLCVAPKVLLVDEPFTAIDPIAATALSKILTEIASDGVGILLTDHQVEKSLDICHQVHLMLDGVVALSGDSETVRQHPLARTRYLG